MALLAACGSAPGTTTATKASGPKRGGTFIYPTEDPPNAPTAYITTGSAIADGAARGQIFSTLVAYDMNLKFVGQLAEKYEISPDGKTYTFHLFQNVKFHDGKPLTSADVEFTAKRYWTPEISPNFGTLFTKNASLTAPDPYTVVITLKEPNATFLSYFTQNHILPKHVYDVADVLKNPANDKPIGSGPFKLKEFNRGSSYELVRHDEYFKKDKPYLDRMVIQFSPDPSSRVVAFEKGEFDFLHAYQVPFDKVRDYRKDARFTVVDGGLGTGTVQMMLLNLDHAQLKKRDVRRAIVYALDRDEMNDKGLFGAGKKATSNIASTNPWFEGKFGTYATDVAKANQLLDSAGAAKGADGKRFTLRLDYASGIDYLVRWGEIIKSQLTRVGIDVQISASDTAAFRDKMFVKRNFDMGIDNWVTGPDPGQRTGPRYVKANIGKTFYNAMGFVNDEYEKIVAEEVFYTDPEKRKAAWIRIQEVLQTELPVIPLVEMPNVQVHSSKFKDLVTDGVFGYYAQPRDDAYQVE